MSTKRAFFEIAAVLHGIYFVVTAFGEIPLVLGYFRLKPSAGDSTARVLPWIGPFAYVVAGIALIAKARSWSYRLIPDDATEEQAPVKSADPPGYFDVGLKLLGLYFLLHYIPRVVRLAVDIKEKGLEGQDIRGWLATALVVGAALVLLLRSNWVVSVMYNDNETRSAHTATDDASNQAPNLSDPVDEPHA